MGPTGASRGGMRSMNARQRERETFGENFRQFFVRGLGIVLPTVLTIWILMAAYGFVQSRIAAPINAGVRQAVLFATPFPRVPDDYVESLRLDLMRSHGPLYQDWQEAGGGDGWLVLEARRQKLERWWAGYSFGLDLIGLVLAVVLIYIVGVLLGSYIGRRLHIRGERLVHRVPLIGRVYPSVKQVTDFFVGDKPEEQKLKFNRVVAVEYPREGMWSVGLVTGETMSAIVDRAGEECVTVFVPSSPTPFTGYVVVARKRDTIELPISVEDAVKYAVSGGVLIPPAQRRPAARGPEAGGPEGMTLGATA